MMKRLGAHQSIAGSIVNALENVHNIGGNSLQIFSSSPRTWQPAKIPNTEIEKFISRKNELGIDLVVFHACYLINLADREETGKKSVSTLRQELMLAQKMKVMGSIVHTGSFRKKENGRYNFQSVDKEEYEALLTNIGKVLETAPDGVQLILENSGTHKIGTTMEELGQIISDLKDDKVRVCLDTCHLHASGYDLATKDKLEEFIDNFDTQIGLDKLAIIHTNDSKDGLGSFRDRHENIGEGNVGIEVFKNLLNHKALEDKPFIIETPGFDGNGPDKKNLDILKSLIK